MKYRLVKIEFIENKKRFWRRLYAREDLNLEEFGIAIATILGATFEHSFLFSKNHDVYYSYAFLSQGVYGNERYYGNVKYVDLAPSFKFEYDTGDGWRFDVTVYERSYDLDCNDILTKMSGVGKGIWEDNIIGLYEYLGGKVKPSTKRKNKDDYRFPWNIDIKTLSEWDNWTEEDMQELSESIEINIKELHKLDSKYKDEALSYFN